SLAGTLGANGAVLPMCDEPVRTQVRARGRAWPLQRFLIEAGGEGPVEGVELDGIVEARPTAEVLDALAGARAIIVGPSNPVISIGPILAVPGLRDAVSAADAPVVAVSPLVRGQVLKGPTAVFMESAGLSVDSEGIGAAYAGLIDGLLADDPTGAVAFRQADVLMADAAGRRRVAEEALLFVEALAG
ncbi:MAG: 2-phospho-L-lactate transferase, partial [Solirubrobacteraceae bacterium]|nr:2-phospho-L-lactate transferase [Solirubrobacteraceae bacterium]